jgi:hypothetical protein
VKTIGLLPHQYRFVADESAPVIVLKGGFRAGKTVAAVAKCLRMAQRAWPLPVVVMEPTYRMVERVFVETARRMFGEWQVPMEWRKADAELVAYPNSSRPLRMLCVSAERPESIMGITAGGGLVDEWELCGEQAVVAVRSRLTPLDDGAAPQLALVGTPEGFGFGYRWTEESPLPGLVLVSARTADNRFVGAAYAEAMRTVLSEAEAREKLEGIRTAPTGTVYSRFTRAAHCRPAPRELGGYRLQVWADFNVDPMVWALAWVGPDSAYVVREVIGRHTDTMAHADWTMRCCAEELGVREDEARRMGLELICDASGSARHTSSTYSDVAICTRAGFRVKHPASNPLVEDRVASVQRVLAEGRLFLDPARATYLVRCLETQPYDSAGRPSKDPSLGLDHGADVVGYGVFWSWPAWKPRANQAAAPNRWHIVDGRRRG